MTTTTESKMGSADGVNDNPKCKFSDTNIIWKQKFTESKIDIFSTSKQRHKLLLFRKTLMQI